VNDPRPIPAAVPADEVARRVKSVVRPEILAERAYRVPDTDGLVTMHANENPHALPPALRERVARAAAAVPLNRYPDGGGAPVKAALARALPLPPGAALVLGNGSDELIQMLALTLAQPGRKVVSVDPGFVMYRLIALLAGMGYAGVPLHPHDFSLNLDALLEALEREQPVITFLAYPNNPTGNLFDAAAIERIIEAAPGLVILDEAYAPFTDRSFLPRLGKWPNLLVMRTLSKMGLAGLRLGYLAGPPPWLAEIDKARLPYNTSVLTQASAAFALRHREVLEDQTRRIRAERARLLAALTAIRGVRPYPSEANFILLRLPEGRAGPVFASLMAGGVLVKNLDGVHPLLADCLRVTVGTPEENAAFVAALAAAL